MSVEKAATLIGKFFPDIQDKLLNTIQLTYDFENDKDNELLLATIEQRTELCNIVFAFSDDLSRLPCRATIRKS